MTEQKFFSLVAKKEQLLLLLNSGFVDDDAWVRFFTEARDAGCHYMAHNMIRRYSHYKVQEAVDQCADYEELGERIEE